jgi:murein DD-endopeptidase MepM/ murein hydrolase activator NlpD
VRPPNFVPVVDARRTRLAAALGGAILVLGVPSGLAQSLAEQKSGVDAKISGLRHDIAAAKAKEGVLTTDIEAATHKLAAVSDDIGELSGRIAQLESELAAHRNNLAQLQARFEEQTRNLDHLKVQYTIAEEQLERRLVELYQSEDTDSFGLLLQVQSLGDLLDQLEYLDSIGRQDQAIADGIARLKLEMKLARDETRRTKLQVAAETKALEEKTAEQVAAREQLIAQQEALEAARSNERSILADVRAQREEAGEELDVLEGESAALEARIRAVQSAPSTGSGSSTGSGVSSSGLIWPVNGVVTSGYGWRWGRLHEGIDIAAPIATPVRAAASGTVIYAGVMSGYGNIIVIDHGGGLSTAYAHLSAIYAGGGGVSQGQTIGSVGSTGHSTGPHLHFEVRVNGTAVDPLGYL